MIKPWLICASAPICGTDTYYVAYSEVNPLEAEEFPYDEIIDDLWNNYSYLLNLEDEDDNEQAYEDWACDCNFHSEELDLEVDNPEDYEIIYDERKDSTSS